MVERKREGEGVDRRVDIIINEQTTGSPLNLFDIPPSRVTLANPLENPSLALSSDLPPVLSS